VFTKPKRQKRVRKKRPLRPLALYRVDADGKITRLRKECPAPQCGAATFMADHADRYSCGRCGLTYMKKNMKEEEKGKGGKAKGKK